ncbi:hypothetical protein [Nostoc sp. ChiQUE01b]|nr:hypothetical protein [Nostoc sp. ChiQUE01b]MDZ8237667.1 hypothetical protein [Nostoc sp. ChiQUE01a]MDZ8264333.1 hypothetical protein [Nostoc sp. ChiQUE01b]
MVECLLCDRAKIPKIIIQSGTHSISERPKFLDTITNGQDLRAIAP